MFRNLIQQSMSWWRFFLFISALVVAMSSTKPLSLGGLTHTTHQAANGLSRWSDDVDDDALKGAVRAVLKESPKKGRDGVESYLMKHFNLCVQRRRIEEMMDALGHIRQPKHKIKRVGWCVREPLPCQASLLPPWRAFICVAPTHAAHRSLTIHQVRS